MTQQSPAEDEACRAAVVGGTSAGAVATVSALLTGVDMQTAIGVGALQAIPAAFVLAALLFAPAIGRRAPSMARALGARRAERGADPTAPIENTVENQQSTEEAFRTLLDAVDDASARYVGRLLDGYTATSRPPDPFLRACGRVLRDGVRADFELLDVFAPWLASVRAEHPFVEVHAVGDGAALKSADGEDASYSQKMTADVSALKRLFFLLKTHGVGGDNASGFWGVIAGPQVLTIQRDVIERLAAVFGP